MSRLAKKPIEIPKEVKVEIKGQELTAQGKQGQASLVIPEELKVIQKENQLIVEVEKQTYRSKQLPGTYHSLITNLLIGVSRFHQKILIFKGIGYRAEAQGNKLKLFMGYSHPVEIKAPKERITFEVEKDKIVVRGVDKQLVGEMAAQIRKVRPVDPYKQKGIKYQGERVIKKEGKAVEKLEESA